MSTDTLTSADIDQQRFGVEVECAGKTRLQTARILRRVIGGTAPALVHDHYQSAAFNDPQGRTWRVVKDGSIRAGANYQCEVVTPPLTLADLPTLCAAIDALRHEGLVADNSCGIHIHLDATHYSAETVRHLALLVWTRESHLRAAIQFNGARDRWAHIMSPAFTRQLAAAKQITTEDLASYWYGTTHADVIADARERKYHRSRYHGLNLHSYFFRGTVEFRWFNGTLDSERLAAYVHLCLALGHKAQTTTRAYPLQQIPVVAACQKYDVRRFLVFLGLNGAMFQRTRDLLTAHLPGDGNSPRPRLAIASA
jgi:hypothetical protein